MTLEGDASPSPVRAGLEGLCPRCGARTLFQGTLAFAKSCSNCGLDFSAFNVGDGPAAFLTLVLGGAIVAAAVVLELTLHPPWWLHVLLWVPIASLSVVLASRAAKGWLLAIEYRNAAREGRIKE